MTWSPLACGIVSGKYDSGIPAYSRASLKVRVRPGRKGAGHQDLREGTWALARKGLLHHDCAHHWRSHSLQGTGPTSAKGAGSTDDAGDPSPHYPALYRH